MSRILIDDIQEESGTFDKDKEIYAIEQLKIKQKELDNLLLAEQLENLIQDREGRKKFADRLFKFLIGFLTCVLLIVLFDGFSFVCFDITDAALVAILTTTTANIIGVFTFVVRYLFPTKK